MNKDHRSQYLLIVSELLGKTISERNKILAENNSYIDDEFINTIVNMAVSFNDVGDKQSAYSFLNMAREIRVQYLKNDLLSQRNIAENYNEVANYYFNRIHGDRLSNLTQALFYFKQSLEIFTIESFPTEYAETFFSIGNTYYQLSESGLRDSFDEAISHFEESLLIFSQVLHPDKWAAAHNNLGVAYSGRTLRGDSEDAEKAIFHLNQALKIRTRLSNPIRWAAAQMNLATAYDRRFQGNKNDNIEKVIFHASQSLEENTPEVNSSKWAFLQYTIGNAYKSLNRGVKEHNIEQAIYHLQLALTVTTKNSCPTEWATIHANLAESYLTLPSDNLRENMRRVIFHSQQAIQVYSEEVFSENLQVLERYIKVANGCLDKLSQADKSRQRFDAQQNTTQQTSLSQANEISQDMKAYADFLIKVYRKVPSISESGDSTELANFYDFLKVNSSKINGSLIDSLKVYISSIFQVSTEEGTKLLFKFLTFFHFLPKCPFGDPISNHEISLSGIEHITTMLNPTSSVFAEVKMNQGRLYTQLAQLGEHPVGNLDNSLACLEIAENVYQANHDKSGWATARMNKGNALHLLARLGETPKECLEKALLCNNDAIKVFSVQNDFKEMAFAKTNQATVYRSFAEMGEDPVDNLNKAVTSFEESVSIQKSEGIEIEGITLMNQGVAHFLLAELEEDVPLNLSHSIACHNKAVEILKNSSNPFTLARAYVNRGNAFRLFAQMAKDPSDFFQIAIDSLTTAASIQEKQGADSDVATTNMNLATCYLTRFIKTPEKDRNKGDLEQSIIYSQLTIDASKSLGLNRQRAQAQMNLSRAQIHLGEIENMHQAVELMRAALTSPNLMPSECFDWGKELGDLGCVLGIYESIWEPSIEGYTKAIDAVENIRNWSISAERKAKILGSAMEVYSSLISIYVEHLNQYDVAVEYIERCKAQNLVDFLSGQEIHPKGDVETSVIERLDYLRHSILVEEQSVNLQASYNGQLDGQSGQSIEKLNLLNSELKRLIQEQIQPIDPTFSLTQKIEPVSLRQLRETLPDNAAAIVWYDSSPSNSSPGRFYTFILEKGKKAPLAITHSREREKELRSAIRTYDIMYKMKEHESLFLRTGTSVEKVFEEQLPEIYAQRDGKVKWKEQLSSLLSEISKALELENIFSQLPDDCTQLILVPHRSLHSLPLHTLPINDGTVLLDHFPDGVCYTPSLRIFDVIKSQKNPPLKYFFSVQNPTQDLNFADIEVSTIRKLFDPHDEVLVRTEARKDTLLSKKLALSNCLHFSCHGNFDSQDPILSSLVLSNSRIDLEEISPEKRTEIVKSLLSKSKRYLSTNENESVIDLKKCLTLGEIFQLDLSQSRLVVLSACETGLIDTTSVSDEYVGLSSSFLYAGARCVISSLWVVDDLSTTLLMVKLYQNLLTETSIPISLCKSQMWLKDATKFELEQWAKEQPFYQKPAIRAQIRRRLHQFTNESCPFSDPFYWAAFRAIGQ